MTASNKKTFIIVLVAAILIGIIPLFVLKGAEFGGSDDAGSAMVSEVQGSDYQPWATPVLEQLIGGELPSEMETLLFCVQTGIGVGVICFILGRYVERKKLDKEDQDL
jgi:cobalt/nickel transport protein